MRKALMALALIVALTACGGGDEAATEGDNGAANEGGGTGSPGPSRSVGIPDALLTELTEIEVDGLEKTDGRVVGRGSAQMTYVYQTPSKWGRKAQALVMVGDVPPGFGGKPDPESLKANRRNLMSMLSRVHIENPDLVFETSSFKLSDGRLVLCTYARSFYERTSESGTSRSTTHTLRTWTFDDRRMLSVTVTPGKGGERIRSAVDQQGEITPEEMLDAAKLVLEALAPKVFAAD